MYKKNAWSKYNDQEMKKLMTFCEDYKDFLSTCKTERECVKYSVELIEKLGFKNINSLKSLKAGDKVYAVNRDKNNQLKMV